MNADLLPETWIDGEFLQAVALWNEIAMKRILMGGLVVIVVAVAGTNGYAGNPKRSITGTQLEYTKWREISAQGVLVMLDAIGPVMKARERLRDKKVIQQEIWADGGKVIIRHVPRQAYRTATTKFVSKLSSLKKVVRQDFKKKGLKVTYGNASRILEKGKRSGWVLEASAGGENCLFGLTGFLGDAGKTKASDEDRYDTVVWLRDCSGNRSFDVVAAFLEKLELVERTEENP